MELAVLFAACERYQSMQESHLQCLAMAESSDIAQLLFEREQQFTDLQNHLTALVQHLRLAAEPAPLLACVQERLQLILQRDARLMEQVQAYRTLLEQRRDHLHYGQRVLHGYSGAPLHPPAQLLDMSS